ncbi:MAG: tRNA ((37)-N6)-dimethylallyltransferase MiaA [Bacteroidota bacterium]
MTTQPTLIVVGGPTASGKTAAAIALAQALGTDIVNVDSRQVYEELNIAVAKPTAEELLSVQHHGIGHVPINYHYNAGTHAEIFRGITQQLLSEKGSAILCGGTGLYIEALLYGMDDLPAVDPDLRSEILDQYVANGIEPLLKMLLQLDPQAGQFVQLNNPQRVMRALELCIQLRKPLKEIYGQEKANHFEGVNIQFVGIEHPREVLYSRINQRVDLMVEEGLLEEAKTLFPQRELKALQTVGYTELFEHFAGDTTLDVAIEKIKQHTRNYAKRQITYFNNRFSTNWISPTDWADFIRKFVKTP